MKTLGYYAREQKPEDIVLPTEETPPVTPAVEPPATAEPAATPPATPETPAVPEPTPEPVRTAKKVKRAELPPPAVLTPEQIRAAVAEGVKEGNKPPVAEPAAPALRPEDAESLEIAEHAAKLLGEKYKDLPEREREWIKARDEFVAQQIAQHGEFDAESDAFKDLVRQKKPVLPRHERRAVEIDLIKTRTLEEADKKYSVREEKLRREIAEIKIGPRIEAETAAVRDDIVSIDDPVVKAYKESPDKAVEEHPLEAPIVERITTVIAADTEEFLRLTNGLADVDAQNPVHQRISGFIEERGKLLDSLPEDKRIRDGKVLISRERFALLLADDSTIPERYSTITNKDVVFMLREHGKARIKAELEATREQLKKAGYSRQLATPPPNGDKVTPPVVTPPAEAPSPKATATRPPGPPATPATSSTPALPKALGYRDRR